MATTMKDAASEFLASKCIAVTGVSRRPKDHGANTVFKRLRDRGYDVFAVNPNADDVEGDPAYDDLRSIPGGVEAVVIATRPEHAEGSSTSGCTAAPEPAACPQRRRGSGARMAFP